MSASIKRCHAMCGEYESPSGKNRGVGAGPPPHCWSKNREATGDLSRWGAKAGSLRQDHRTLEVGALLWIVIAVADLFGGDGDSHFAEKQT